MTQRLLAYHNVWNQHLSFTTSSKQRHLKAVAGLQFASKSHLSNSVLRFFTPRNTRLHLMVKTSSIHLWIHPSIIRANTFPAWYSNTSNTVAYSLGIITVLAAQVLPIRIMGIVGKREASLHIVFCFVLTDWWKVSSLALEDTFHTTLLFWVVFGRGWTDGATLSDNVQPWQFLRYTFLW